MSISANGHTLEPTLFSITDTNLERTESSGRPSYRSDTTAVGSSLSANPGTPHFDGKDQREARAPRTFVLPTNEHRCLILCFDGTGDQFDADNSNIVQLVSALKKDDRTKQMVYYQSGIGTYTSPKFVTPLTTKISLILDSMIAWNLDSHIMAGYEFLMQNYTANDRICIFGFSRGAYIARSLAGMLHKVGLLPVDNHQQVPFAYRMYARADLTQANAFKKAFSNDVPIDFVGVWDTVDSVGLIPRRLPLPKSNTAIRTFRHAVSLDEHRAKFKVNLWHREEKLRIHTPLGRPTWPTWPEIPKYRHTRSTLAAQEETKFDTDETASANPHRKTRQTDDLEVWFAGCHCDVGGGSVQNDTRHCLARIPLRWMIRECFKADTGIIFDAQRLQELGLDPATLYPIVVPRPPPLPVGTAKLESLPRRTSWLSRLLSQLEEDVPIDLKEPARGMEEEEDLKDALCPIYDQLQLKPFWWILELIPMSFRYQGSDGQWITNFRPNLGRPRKILHQRPRDMDPDHPHFDADYKPVVNLKVHRSVQTRREARDAKGRCYVNRARFHCEPDWVD
ncbi:hypothetical protein C8R44DRAFT_991193 [Mycena epipterygia]|nr:hypothetical protein C8R44DRAFT_991193 [Mycena epipterygia]